MALIALAGCVNVPPRDPGALDIPLPHAWLAHPIATDGVTLEGWVETFHDANLSALVQEALRRNYDLKAAAARVEAARAQARIEGASRLPQLAFTANATRERDSLDGEHDDSLAYQTTLESCLI
jgi:multidrug efflux system outer membrane protein